MTQLFFRSVIFTSSPSKRWTTKMISTTSYENDCMYFSDYDIYIQKFSLHLWAFALIFYYPRTINGLEFFYFHFNNRFLLKTSSCSVSYRGIIILLKIQTNNIIEMNSILKNIPNLWRKIVTEKKMCVRNSRWLKKE